MIRNRTYTTWQSMIQRCRNENCKSYCNYGGRGIRVCERWKSFSAFAQDMGEKPLGYTIDRINNDGDYEPGNCRWATMKQQNRNCRRNKPVVFEGKTICLADLCERFSIPYTRLRERVNRLGWPLDKALVAPRFTKKKKAM